jgi:hypothetical protein
MVSLGPHRAGASTLALCRSASVPNLPPEQLVGRGRKTLANLVTNVRNVLPHLQNRDCIHLPRGPDRSLPSQRRPVVPQLNELFGEHTFFLNSNVLNMQSAKVVNAADWSGIASSALEPHEPETTDVVIKLGFRH